jgi:hypothetical protein
MAGWEVAPLREFDANVAKSVCFGIIPGRAEWFRFRACGSGADLNPESL